MFLNITWFRFSIFGMSLELMLWSITRHRSQALNKLDESNQSEKHVRCVLELYLKQEV